MCLILTARRTAHHRAPCCLPVAKSSPWSTASTRHARACVSAHPAPQCQANPGTEAGWWDTWGRAVSWHLLKAMAGLNMSRGCEARHRGGHGWPRSEAHIIQPRLWMEMGSH